LGAQFPKGNYSKQMKAPYQEFNRTALKLRPLAQRQHDLHLADVLPIEALSNVDSTFVSIATAIQKARLSQAAVVLMMGAHVIRAGVQRYIIDLMEKGHINGIALNGAGMIHDFEYALIGATTECVSRYIKDGRFGLWQETGAINDIVATAHNTGLGLGEAMGREIHQKHYPHHDISLMAAGYRLGIPVTVHVGIGYDIIFEFPNCDGAAYGATSYRDFLRLAGIMQKLENGVVMNFGSAVMAPEVYLKVLAMVRNVAHQNGRHIREFTTLVCDLIKLPPNYRVEPDKADPCYYFRPLKTMLVRTVTDGGKSYYVRGHHADTIPQLWTALNQSKACKQ
jgi:hypothetical protein